MTSKQFKRILALSLTVVLMLSLCSCAAMLDALKLPVGGRADCELCSGAGEADCKFCSGTGRASCNNCLGAGFTNSPKLTDCTYCIGGTNGGVYCSSCSGLGSTLKSEVEPCGYCSYSGKVFCFDCSGDGKVDCECRTQSDGDD